MVVERLLTHAGLVLRRCMLGGKMGETELPSPTYCTII